MTRLLLAAPTYLPSPRANTIQVMKMAQALRILGEEVLMAIPDTARQPVPNWEAIAHQYGLSRRFEMNWLPVQPRWRSSDYAWQVVNLARRTGVDWVYTRHPQAAALCSWAGIPTVLEVHDIPRGLWPAVVPGFFVGERRGGTGSHHPGLKGRAPPVGLAKAGHHPARWR